MLLHLIRYIKKRRTVGEVPDDFLDPNLEDYPVHGVLLLDGLSFRREQVLVVPKQWSHRIGLDGNAVPLGRIRAERGATLQ